MWPAVSGSCCLHLPPWWTVWLWAVDPLSCCLHLPLRWTVQLWAVMDLLSLICFLRLHHSTQERGLLHSTADVPSLQTSSLGNSSVIHVWRSGIWCRFCGWKPRSWQGFLRALQKNALPRPLHCWRWLTAVLDSWPSLLQRQQGHSPHHLSHPWLF